MPATPHEFELQRTARRGEANGKRMRVALWEELIRTGETAHAAARRYQWTSEGPPGWCFDRFGMSRTRVPDGRIVCIAGEHEDYYDPNFFIYNDVIVIQPRGDVEIFGYSPEIFPPTDFHTATLVGDAIYIIGRVGYRNERGKGSTPIYRLDLRTMRIRKVVSGGNEPGWIARHRAQLHPDARSIRIGGGEILGFDSKGREQSEKNNRIFCFDTTREVWSITDGDVPHRVPVPEHLPFGWTRFKSDAKSQAMRDAIVRAVAPEHPLFCDDFWPIARNEDWPYRVIFQRLDGSRWGICDEPDYTGREERPLPVTFHVTFNELLKNIAEEPQAD